MTKHEEECCPCNTADAFVAPGYQIDIDKKYVPALIQTINSVDCLMGRSLTMTSFNFDHSDLNSHITKILMTLDVFDECPITRLEQVQTLMNIATDFDASFQQVKGVVVTTVTGHSMHIIASVIAQASVAGIEINAKNTLFPKSNPIPVKIFFQTPDAEALAAILNCGLYM